MKLKEIEWLDLEILEFSYGENKVSRGFINNRVMVEIICYKWSGRLGREFKQDIKPHIEYIINFVSCFDKHRLTVRNKKEFRLPYPDNEWNIYSENFSLDETKEIAKKEIENYLKSFLYDN